MPVAHSPQRPAARTLPVWLWRAYLHGALWPLLAIELLLFALACTVGVAAGHALDAAWETRVRAALARQAELEARSLAQRLAGIAGTATLLADRTSPGRLRLLRTVAGGGTLAIILAYLAYSAFRSGHELNNKLCLALLAKPAAWRYAT